MTGSVVKCVSTIDLHPECVRVSVLGDLVVQYGADEMPIASGRASWVFPTVPSYDRRLLAGAPNEWDETAAEVVAAEVMARVALTREALRLIHDATAEVLAGGS